MPGEARIVANFVIGAPLGRGGSSEVFAARDRSTGREVAIKVLRAGLADDEASIARLFEEAAKLRAIVHPNVVRLIDYGRDPAGCYLVMEKLAGVTLAERLRAAGRLDEITVRRLAAAIADGAAAAHDRGIVHRDLKPSNIMLVDDTVKILDFGIARSIAGTSALATGPRIGTPAYMAPEQLTGSLIAPCVDVWALGVIMFEAITGRLPFVDFADGRCPQLVDSPPRPSELVELSPSLDDLILRCLDKAPGKRPASLRDVADELRGESPERITQAAPLPLVVAPPAAAPPPPHAAKRRRWLWAAVPVAVVTAALLRPGSAPPAPAPALPAAAAPAPIVAAPVPVPPAAVPAAPPAPIEIDLSSEPSRAEIEVAGARRGRTPAHLTIDGAATITIAKPGYRSARITAEHAGPLHVRLVPLPRAHRTPAGETLD